MQIFSIYRYGNLENASYCIRYILSLSQIKRRTAGTVHLTIKYPGIVFHAYRYGTYFSRNRSAMHMVHIYFSHKCHMLGTGTV
jgi:hypothetical protein